MTLSHHSPMVSLGMTCIGASAWLLTSYHSRLQHYNWIAHTLPLPFVRGRQSNPINNTCRIQRPQRALASHGGSYPSRDVCASKSKESATWKGLPFQGFWGPDYLEEAAQKEFITVQQAYEVCTSIAPISGQRLGSASCCH
eukprot:2223003-Amphidinium_carterae.1